MEDSQRQVGVIGLGLLGRSLTERLIRHGCDVLGFDIDAARRQEMSQIGGRACNHPAEVFARCDVVLLSLPNSEIVFSVLNDSTLSWRKTHTVVDTTTGNPSQMIDLGRSMSKRGVGYVEACVAGSSEQCREGKAVLFIGGETEPVASVRSILDCLAEKRFHLGGVGEASRFKLVHNLLLGLHRAALAEGLHLAGALGFDLDETLEVLEQTPAASAVMATKGRRMINRDYTPQARLTQHLKDVRLLLDEAARAGVDTPLSEIHRKLLERAEGLGYGDSDNSAIIEAYRGAEGGGA
ncbi:MAG: NAD(P)-dependent oxidoreductase [Planctomycetota bacterium]|jgi:3-hydroxyisobutyrate dehydrogenase-like beta-hydroxyacid dehydrogenase